MTQELAGKKEGNIVYVYRVQDLWDAPAKQFLGDVPYLGTDDFWVFNAQQQTHKTLVDHVKRVERANLSYPVTLYQDGRVADGFHRILHASSQLMSKILIRQLVVDPVPVATLTLEEFIKTL